ncbi:glycosyltransferase N-terminal domain-containing protein [Roseobacter sp.]|uniref:3-deoxy-D-manno-octulosonic acid transferase n=1 Tax=Roseobacter sp. TaxID=1907202 RepID=UPI003299829F
MGRSLGMTAYRALSRRSAARSFDPSGPRPKGELIWLHAADTSNHLAAQDLAQRLCRTRDGLQALITFPDQNSLDKARATTPPESPVFLDHVPSEHPSAVRAFLRNWAPDMGVWIWGGLRPTLLHELHQTDCPMALIDADTRGFDGRRDRWLPDLTRELLSEFVGIMVRNTATEQRLQVLGIRPRHMQVTAPLQAGGQALPCDETDLNEMATALSGRPVWLATFVQDDEASVIFAAHRQAVRYSHRLLLILHPAQRGSVARLTQQAEAQGFRVGAWPSPGEPSEAVQVMIAEDALDLGLFYRLAPVSFLGSSLQAGHGGCNPFEAAALGSAVLYGPNVRRYLPFYTRLANAGAARIVKDAASLGSAVTRLIAPDQAAAMAHAGWDVISHGAEMSDDVIALVEDTLDARLERRNAHA